MVCEEDVLPYERPALTKAFLNERAPARLPGFHTSVGGGGERQTEEWYREKGVETKVSTKVAKCDFAKKRRNGDWGDHRIRSVSDCNWGERA